MAVALAGCEAVPYVVQPEEARLLPPEMAADFLRSLSAGSTAVDVGLIDAVNWQWGYVVMQIEQRQGMQVSDRVFSRVGDNKLWMTVRRVNGNQASAVPESDLQRYAVNGRICKE